jgi:hypothetical protein
VRLAYSRSAIRPRGAPPVGLGAASTTDAARNLKASGAPPTHLCPIDKTPVSLLPCGAPNLHVHNQRLIFDRVHQWTCGRHSICVTCIKQHCENRNDLQQTRVHVFSIQVGKGRDAHQHTGRQLETSWYRANRLCRKRTIEGLAASTATRAKTGLTPPYRERPTPIEIAEKFHATHAA